MEKRQPTSRRAPITQTSPEELRALTLKAERHIPRSSLKSLIRDAVLDKVPESVADRMRSHATASLTESSSRRPSAFNGPKHVYAGTVSAKTKGVRRRRNKAARLARRVSR